MSLFRKQPPTQTAVPSSTPVAEAAPAAVPGSAATQPTTAPLFDGPRVDIAGIYRAAKLSTEELDRVVRAEELLHLLPSKATNTREIVEATFRAFGVDRAKIIEAATRQGDALEAFIRYSHDQTQRVLDAAARQIAELEAEIERCRDAAAQASREGDERARSVNDVLLKVQQVLEFFGQQGGPDIDIEADTALARPEDAEPKVPSMRAKPPTQRPS